MPGAEGVDGWAFKIALEEAEEIHPEASSTTKEYVVDAAKEEIVVVVPEPVTVDAPNV
jgi:hypothetical protein